jgi:RimJ/RimL family protein N-acetyltransferase
MKTSYIFKSQRLGFRNWKDTDLVPMTAINMNPEAMEFFPELQNAEYTAQMIARMQNMFNEKKYCYFAVDRLDLVEFIGFIGLCDQTFESDFTPCVDIGWRLSPNHWYRGFATEGAIRCLEYASDTLRLNNVKAMAPVINIKSIAVMKKIGMTEVKHFIHPKLLNNEGLKDCVLYESNLKS